MRYVMTSGNGVREKKELLCHADCSMSFVKGKEEREHVLGMNAGLSHHLIHSSE